MAKNNKKRNKIYGRNSTNVNSRFRAVSQNTRACILEDYMAGVDKYDIMEKYRVSLSEIKRVIKAAKRDSKEIRKQIDNYSELDINRQDNYRFGSLGQFANFSKDTRLDKYNKEEPDIGDTNEHIQPDDSELVFTNDIKILTEINNTNNESTKVDVISDTTKTHNSDSGGNSYKISDEIIRKIMNDLKSERFSLISIANTYGVSKSTVSNIKNKNCKRYKLIAAELNMDSSIEPVNNEEVVNIDQVLTLPALPNNDPKMVKVTKEVEKIIENESILMNRVLVKRAITVGMIDGRHDLPVTEFMFSSVDNNLIIDYNRQYEMACHRIKALTKNEPAGKTIIMYVTGLGSVLASIIRACADLKVQLVLMHYCPNSNSYASQVMPIQGDNIATTDNIMPPQLSDITCRNMYTCGCTALEFVQKGCGYELIEYTLSDKDKPKYKDVTLFSSSDIAWNYWKAMCENAPTSVTLILNKVAISSVTNKLITKRTVSKMMNDIMNY